MPRTAVSIGSHEMTYYYWDEVNDNLFGEEDENGEVSASYTHEPGLYGELIAQERDGETRYYNYDGLGNTVELTDENQNVTDTYEYSAFGEEVARTGTTENSFRYKGAMGYYTNSDTNDIYVRARTYEPRVARWLSFDPLEFSDGVNRYEYASNSPVNFIDANGLLALKMHFGPIARLRCDLLASLISSFLDTPEEKEFFLWYTSPLTTGKDRNLGCSEVVGIINGSTVGGQPTSVHQGLDDALSVCRQLGGGPHSVQGVASSGNPYRAALGSYTLRITVTCVGCCADVLIEVEDTYDFNILGAKRKLSAQLKTMGVQLSQIAAKCIWIPYKISGRCAFIHCPAFLDPNEPVV